MQTRMGIDRVTFYSLGAHKGPICLAYGKVPKYQDFAIRRT